MKRLLLILLMTTSASAYSQNITAWNAGELSPFMLRRISFAKYDNACKQLQNMLIRSEGPVERRPGTKYIAEVETSSEESRLIKFEYSKTDAYIIEMGDEYMRFYREGGQILSGASAYEISTDYEEAELFDVQFVQLADTMYLVDGNDPPQKLTRDDHDDWTIEDVNFITGPFLDENTTTTTIEPNGLTGTITLIADANIFYATHVGALWQIGFRRDDSPLTGTLDANESSSEITIGGDYTYNIQGTWTGDVVLEKSFDSGVSWEVAVPRNNADSAVNEDHSGVETEDDVTYRVTMSNYEDGSADYHLRVNDYIDYGVVKIAAYVDANEVQATVVSALTAANTTTTKWSEGAWSDYRSWPQTIEFHEQRLMFGASDSYPQTIWATRTASGADDDYENMTEGVDADDALTYVLPGQNPIQFMLSQTYLIIGTLGGVGRWGSDDDSSPITPTDPTSYRLQATNGSAYMQAILAGDAILYVERGGHRIREFAYSLERDRFTAPDLTVLAEHITGDGIVDIAYQSRPDSVLWCVTDDGGIATLTYNRLQEVVGWSRIVTDGDFESVATIPGTDEDEVWVIVNRTVDGSTVRYVEQFQPRDWGDQEDAWFVDSGLEFDGGAAVAITAVTKASPAAVTLSSWPESGSGTALADDDQIRIVSVVGMTELNNNIYTVDDANSTDFTFTLADAANVGDINSVGFTTYVSGGTVQRFEKDFTDLDHLEDKVVTVLVDGVAHGTDTVASGAVGNDIWGNKVKIGLPFTSKVETMPIISQSQTGVSLGRVVKISSVVVDFLDSLGVNYGRSATANNQVVFYDPTEDLDDPIPLYTGWKSLPFLHGTYRDATVYLETDGPLPFAVRAIGVDIVTTEQ